LIETIFAWPGIGRLIITAIFQRDYPVVLAAAFVSAIVVVLGSFIADVLYTVVDPRVRIDEGEA
jgi:ABC-type dipeptide/oligopeptide/nickel transport system permease component